MISPNLQHISAPSPCATLALDAAMKLTETRLDVLRLIAAGRALGDYVPRYKPGAHRGRGAFPVTIAIRAANDLLKAGYVRRVDDKNVLTPAGELALAAATTT